MVKLYKEGEDISTPLQIGDIIEIESGIFVKVKSVIKETEETFVGIKKNNTLISGEIIQNGKSYRQESRKEERNYRLHS